MLKNSFFGKLIYDHFSMLLFILSFSYLFKLEYLSGLFILRLLILDSLSLVISPWDCFGLSSAFLIILLMLDFKSVGFYSFRSGNLFFILFSKPDYDFKLLFCISYGVRWYFRIDPGALWSGLWPFSRGILPLFWDLWSERLVLPWPVLFLFGGPFVPW